MAEKQAPPVQPVPSFKDKIQKGRPAAPSKFIVMGDPMTGKTTLAAKAPRPLFISTDNNAAKAGLDAVAADSIATVREAVQFFEQSDEYDTLVIDTIEGIAELFEQSLIAAWNAENEVAITSLTDVGYGKLTGQFNKRLSAFADTILSLKKNVIVLTYTKRQVDELSNSIILASELKSIRQFTKYADAMILTAYDGEKYSARVVSKRTVMAGEVDTSKIESFLTAAGWNKSQRKVKLNSAK